METIQLHVHIVYQSLGLGYIRFLDSVDLGGHFGTHEKKSRGGAR